MNYGDSNPQNRTWEGEAPAEPPQSRPRESHIALSPAHDTPLLNSQDGRREGEAPAEPPQSQPRNCIIAPPTVNEALSPHVAEYPIRKRPAHGIVVPKDGPAIVYLTVCTKGRKKWLAQPGVHAALCRVWQKADAWRVGRYVIMPDHLHLFAAWIEGSINLEAWVQFWKSQFSKALPEYSGCWQSGHWDTRIRGVKAYESKWAYVRDNPVRHGLVATYQEWPYQGEMCLLDWNG